MWKFVIFVAVSSSVRAQIPFPDNKPPVHPLPPMPVVHAQERYGVDQPYVIVHRIPGYGDESPFGPQFPPNHHRSYPQYPHHPHYRDSDEGRNCYSCKSLKANCDDTKKGWECKKPHVTYFSTMDGCEKAVLTCKSAKDRSMKIETKNEDVLTEGIGGDKLIKCKNGRWTARDIKDHEVEFRTVRCLVRKDHFNREPY